MTDTAPGRQAPRRYSTSRAAALFHDLRRRRVRYAVLNRRVQTAAGRVFESIDLLIEGDDLADLERGAQAIGLRRESGRSVSYRVENSRGGRVHVLHVSARTELTYGRRGGWLRSAERERSVLRRARLVDESVGIAPGDELVDLVLRCVFDAREIDSASRRRLQELVDELRQDPIAAGHAAERVHRELAPALTWDDLLTEILNERGRAAISPEAGSTPTARPRRRRRP